MKKILAPIFFILLNFTFSLELVDRISNRETIVYSSLTGTQQLIITENIYNLIIEDKLYHRIELFASDGGTAELVFARGDFRPLKMFHYDIDNQLRSSIVYKDSGIEVEIKEKKMNYVFPEKGRGLIDPNTFFHLVRCYPRDRQEIQFLVFMPEMRRSLSIYLKPVATETMVFMRKKVVAIKYELGLAGLVEAVFFPQKFYFWVMQDAPYAFLRFEGTDPLGVKTVTETKYFDIL